MFVLKLSCIQIALTFRKPGSSFNKLGSNTVKTLKLIFLLTKFTLLLPNITMQLLNFWTDTQELCPNRTKAKFSEGMIIMQHKILINLFTWITLSVRSSNLWLKDPTLKRTSLSKTKGKDLETLF